MIAAVQINSCAARKIVFVAATNQPWLIDEAIQRSGRMDKKIYVGPPDREATTDILTHHMRGRPLSCPEDVERFAAEIDGKGYSASDLELIIKEAAKLAMKTGEDIGLPHLRAVVAEKVLPSISLEQEASYKAFLTR